MGPSQGPTQNTNTGGTSSATTSSTTAPWAPTQGLLSSLLGNLSGINPGMTEPQTNAIGQLINDTSGLPNYAGTAKNVADQMLGSTATNNSQGLLTAVMGGLSQGNENYKNQFGNLQGAYGDYKAGAQPALGALSGYLSPDFLDPMKNPGMSDLLNTLKGDITSDINGQFAAAGRFNSPANTQALSRGLSQGLAKPLLDAYASNAGLQQGAANSTSGILSNLFGGANTVFGGAGNVFNADVSKFNAGNTTAQGWNSLTNDYYNNLIKGLGVGQSIPGIAAAPATGALAAANTGYGLPLNNIAAILGLTTPVAGLGNTMTGTSSGVNTGTGQASTTQPFGIQQILGSLIGGAGALGSLGQGASGLSTLFAGL